MDTKLFSRQIQNGLFTAVRAPYQPTGSTFWVKSSTGSDSAGYGLSPDAPCATVDYALGLCTASKGDIVYLMPGHAQTLTTATALVLDVAGVRVIGLGRGALRPTFTYGATDAICSFTAIDCVLENVLLIGAIDDIVTGISVAVAADGATIKDVEMRDGSSITEFLIGISIGTGSPTGTCSDVTIDGFKFCGLAGGMTSCIYAAGICDRLKIVNTYIRCVASSYAVDLTVAASTNLWIADSTFINADTTASLGVNAHDSSTGYLFNCHVTNGVLASSPTSVIEGFGGDGLAYSQCYGSNAFGAQGILKPVVDS